MSNEKLTIKQWAVDDRPREKLLRNGQQSLSDAELIAILIGSGNREMSAVELSKHILNKANNNLNELGKQSLTELMKNKGIGEAKAITIVAALELGKRRKLAEIVKKEQISCSIDVYKIMNPKLQDLPHEEFWAIYTNRKNKVIEKVKISQGGVSGTIADIRIVIKTAIEKLATGIVLVHNHPSGDVKPSQADITLTEKLKKAANLFEINVFEHIIIGDNKYYSFADEGVL